MPSARKVGSINVRRVAGETFVQYTFDSDLHRKAVFNGDVVTNRGLKHVTVVAWLWKVTKPLGGTDG